LRVSPDGSGGFRSALAEHLGAIRDRDLARLAATVAPDGLVLVMSDGRLIREPADFLEAHRGWFAMDNWTLDTESVQTFEGPELGVAVLRLTYHERPAGRPPVTQQSYLTLVFQRRGDRWVMVQDQNTPIKQ
jgi:uncharacterized protein (TIGR02246 family)